MTAKHSSMMRLAMAACALAILFDGAPAAADDDMLSHFLVAPGKYVLFNCQQLDLAGKTNEKRMRELEGLMARSGSNLANAIAYKPEYLQLRGEQADIQREAADKKCKTAPGAAPRRMKGAIIR